MLPISQKNILSASELKNMLSILSFKNIEKLQQFIITIINSVIRIL